MKRKRAVCIFTVFIAVLCFFSLNHLSVKADKEEIPVETVTLEIPDPIVGEDALDYLKRIRLVGDYSTKYFEIVYPASFTTDSSATTVMPATGGTEKPVFKKGTTYAVRVRIKLKDAYKFQSSTIMLCPKVVDNAHPGLTGTADFIMGDTSYSTFLYNGMATGIEKKYKVTSYFGYDSSIVKTEEHLPGEEVKITAPALQNQVFVHYETGDVTPKNGNYQGPDFIFTMPAKDVTIKGAYSLKGDVVIKCILQELPQEENIAGPESLPKVEKTLIDHNLDVSSGKIVYDVTSAGGFYHYFDRWEATGTTLSDSQKKNPELSVPYSGGEVTLTAYFVPYRHIRIRGYQDGQSDDIYLDLSGLLRLPGDEIDITEETFQSVLDNHQSMDDWGPYGFDHFEIVSGLDYEEEDPTELHFTMPDNSVDIRAIFKKDTITINYFRPGLGDKNVGSPDRITSDDEKVLLEETSVKKGEKFTYNAENKDTEDIYCYFDHWTAEGMELTEEQAKNPKLSFDFPGGNVILTANFKAYLCVNCDAIHEDDPKGVKISGVCGALVKPGDLVSYSYEDIKARIANTDKYYTDKGEEAWSAHYRFSHFEVVSGITLPEDQKNQDHIEFTVPDDNVILRAVFVTDRKINLTIYFRYRDGHTEEMGFTPIYPDSIKLEELSLENLMNMEGREFRLMEYVMNDGSPVKIELDSASDKTTFTYQPVEGVNQLSVYYDEEILIKNYSMDKTEFEGYWALPGETVSISALKPEGQKLVFYEWTSDDIRLTTKQKNKNPLLIKAPDHDISVRSIYKKLSKGFLCFIIGGGSAAVIAGAFLVLSKKFPKLWAQKKPEKPIEHLPEKTINKTIKRPGK